MNSTLNLLFAPIFVLRLYASVATRINIALPSELTNPVVDRIVKLDTGIPVGVDEEAPIRRGNFIYSYS